jgi:DNA-binding MarR family transcriptional regulator
MSEQTGLLREMRDLLLVIAEPALEKRDRRLRQSLRQIVGKGIHKINAVKLMDGQKSQGEIQKACGIDAGGLSRLAKGLRQAGLLDKDANENLKLLISIPPNFFEQSQAKD